MMKPFAILQRSSISPFFLACLVLLQCLEILSSISRVGFLIFVPLLSLADPVSGETTSSAIQVESFKDLQSATKKTEPGLVISEITFKLKTPDKEAVWIQGNRLFTPSTFAIEEDKPRFVIDIKDGGPVKRELSRIVTGGKLIERIRTFYHQENRTLRVVLDLQPSKSYRINQFFYPAQNIYAVEVEGK